MFIAKIIATSAIRAFVGGVVSQLVKRSMETYVANREAKLRTSIEQHLDAMYDAEQADLNNHQ